MNVTGLSYINDQNLKPSISIVSLAWLKVGINLRTDIEFSLNAIPIQP